MIVNLFEAKTRLSQLVAMVLRGEEVIIAKAGVPVARLVPCHAKGRREPGAWRGRVVIHDDFEELPAEMAAAFRGERP